MRVEGRVLARREELGREAEDSLARPSRRLDVVTGREHVELGRVGRRAERQREATASLVVVQAVQRSAREFVLPDQDSLDAQAPVDLVEERFVDPGAAVDVVLRRVAAALQMLESLELARAVVDEPLDGHLLDLTRAVEREIARTARVVEDRRGEEDSLAAHRAVRGTEAGRRIVKTLLALVHRCAVEHLPRSAVVDLVQHDVSDRVSVSQHDARVIGRPREDERAIRALGDRLGFAGVEIETDGGHDRLLTRLHVEVGGRSLEVDVEEARPPSTESLFGQRLRETAFDWDDVGHVVLVPVAVDHQHDLPEPGQHAVRVALDQLGVLQRKLRGEQRLGDAAGGVHHVQAQVPGEVRDEVQPPVRKLRLEKEASREQRLDSIGRYAFGGVYGDGVVTRPRRLPLRGPTSGMSTFTYTS